MDTATWGHFLCQGGWLCCSEDWGKLPAFVLCNEIIRLDRMFCFMGSIIKVAAEHSLSCSVCCLLAIMVMLVPIVSCVVILFWVGKAVTWLPPCCAANLVGKIRKKLARKWWSVMQNIALKPCYYYLPTTKAYILQGLSIAGCNHCTKLLKVESIMRV